MPSNLVILYILGICFTVANSYLFIINSFFLQKTISLVSMIVLAFAWIVTIEFNPLFRELVAKWKK